MRTLYPQDFPKNSIYGLRDPATLELRYVGRSSVGYREPRRYITGTFHRHADGSFKNDRYVNRWIRTVLEKKQEPEIIVLEDYEHDLTNIDAVLNNAEILAIAFYREQGCKLTNETIGGEGVSGRKHTEKAKRAIGAANSIALLGHMPWNKGTAKREERSCILCSNSFFVNPNSSKKFCSHVCYSSSGQSVQARERNSLSHLGKKNSPEHIERAAAIHRVPVVCVNDGKTYGSVKEAAAAYDLCSDTVRKIARGLQGSTLSGLSFVLAETFDQTQRDKSRIRTSHLRNMRNDASPEER